MKVIQHHACSNKVEASKGIFTVCLCSILRYLDVTLWLIRICVSVNLSMLLLCVYLCLRGILYTCILVCVCAYMWHK